MVRELLDGNRRFVANEFSQNSAYYKEIAQQQHPRLLWIGCSDSRVSEDVVTASKPGTIFAHRNIANIVAYSDMNLAAILEFAIIHLKVPDIVICGHTRCGGILAINDGLTESYISDWLLAARPAKERVDELERQQTLSIDEKLTRLSEENVKTQVKHLHDLLLIRAYHQKGGAPRVHGWLYSVETGHINVLVDGYQTAGNEGLTVT
jgi:carbonic anhydrase